MTVDLPSDAARDPSPVDDCLMDHSPEDIELPWTTVLSLLEPKKSTGLMSDEDKPWIVTNL